MLGFEQMGGTKTDVTVEEFVGHCFLNIITVTQKFLID